MCDIIVPQNISFNGEHCISYVVVVKDVDVDRVYERRPKASVPASCNHFTIY